MSRPVIAAGLAFCGVAATAAVPGAPYGPVMIMAAALTFMMETNARLRAENRRLRDDREAIIAEANRVISDMESRLEAFRDEPDVSFRPDRETDLARLGFPPGHEPDESEIRSARRRALKAAHPEAGGDADLAAAVIESVMSAAERLSENLSKKR